MNKTILSIVLFSLTAFFVALNSSSTTWGDFRSCDQRFNCLSIDCGGDQDCKDELDLWLKCNDQSSVCQTWWDDFKTDQTATDAFPQSELSGCIDACPSPNQEITNVWQCLKSCGGLN